MLFYTIVSPQVRKLQQCDRRLRAVKHGSHHRSGWQHLPIGRRIRLHGKQLRGGADQAVRIQKTVRTHPEDSGFRLPGRRISGRMPRIVLELAVPLSFLRLWRHR